MPKSENSVGRFFEENTQKPVDFDRGAGGQIFDALKLAILRMDIPPGSLISEVEVGRRFSASRTPVREAFLQLREAGLIVTRPSRGNFVTKLRQDRIREARFVRQAIELAVVEKLCDAGLSETSKAKIEDVLTQQQDYISKDDQSRFFELDDEFHLHLARATGYDRISNLLSREKMLLDRLRVLSLDDMAYRQSLYDQHLEIFEAILSQDKTLARALMDSHLMKILETLSDIADQNGEYFE